MINDLLAIWGFFNNREWPSRWRDPSKRRIGAVVIGFIVLVSLALLSSGQDGFQEARAASSAGEGTAMQLVIPLADADRGRISFVTKGCVICHAVQGVGGAAAPALDADDSATLDLLGFVARMWRGAPAMLELQAVELGYQITLTPQEIADLAAFAADLDAQEAFSIEDVPEPMRDWMLEAPYWDDGEWPENLPESFPRFEILPEGDGPDEQNL